MVYRDTHSVITPHLPEETGGLGLYRKVAVHYKITLVACIFFVATLYPQHAPAVEKCNSMLSPSELNAHGTRLKQLLKGKAYAALEDEFQNRQLQVVNGKLSDQLLRADIDVAFDADPAQEPLLSEWVHSYPRSFFARIARAEHYISTGYQKRGSEFASKTTEEQFLAMRQLFEKANDDLEYALNLSKTSALVYVYKISITGAGGDHAAMANLIQDAQSRFPKSLAIRLMAANYLNPKWGGSPSFDAVKAVMDKKT